MLLYHLRLALVHGHFPSINFLSTLRSTCPAHFTLLDLMKPATVPEHTNHGATHCTSVTTLPSLPAHLNTKYLPQHPALRHARSSHDAPRPNYGQSLNIYNKLSLSLTVDTVTTQNTARSGTDQMQC